MGAMNKWKNIGWGFVGALSFFLLAILVWTVTVSYGDHWRVEAMWAALTRQQQAPPANAAQVTEQKEAKK